MQIQDWQGKSPLTLAIGTDHGGYELKCKLIPILESKGIRVVDCGPYEFDAKDNYPEFAHPVARAVSMGKTDVGLLICRSGVGMGIAANRYSGVRSVVAYSPAVARASRCHNCSNILVLPADYADETQQLEILDAWLSTPFEGSRHVKRLEMIENGAWFPVGQIRHSDPELAEMIMTGYEKYEVTLDLIASENQTSIGVKAASGTYLTDKYAEGDVGHRHYPDCATVDQIESLAIARACELFGAEAANVQPYSGSMANLAVYAAFLNPGDSVMALNPARGGHSTHFSQDHVSGNLYKVNFYELDANTELINYNVLEKMVLCDHPKMIVAGGSAYPRNIDFARLREIADRVGAKLVVDMAHVAGLVAAGIYSNPVPYADVVTSTTHKTLRGPRGGLILCKKDWIERINKAVFPMIQGGPLVHVIAAKAIAFKEALAPEFKIYQETVVQNAKVLSETFKSFGIRSITDGTDSHMLLLDMRPTSFDGITIANALESANINVNPIRIPSDELYSSQPPSGIRVGTPTITTQGATSDDMPQIVRWVMEVAKSPNDNAVIARVRDEVAQFKKNLKKR